MRRRWFWVPPVAWMALILWLGSDSGSAERTGRVILPLLRSLFPGASPVQLDAMHALVRKLGHLTEYAVLAGLWLRALRGSENAALSPQWMAWGIAVAWAIVDETRQSFVASRTASPYDVAIDAGGALVPAILAGPRGRERVDTVTRTLLWIAAVGGGGVLVVNIMTDVASGALWLTVPLAGAALYVWRRARP